MATPQLAVWRNNNLAAYILSFTRLIDLQSAANVNKATAEYARKSDSWRLQLDSAVYRRLARLKNDSDYPAIEDDAVDIIGYLSEATPLELRSYFLLCNCIPTLHAIFRDSEQCSSWCCLGGHGNSMYRSVITTVHAGLLFMNPGDLLPPTAFDSRSVLKFPAAHNPSLMVWTFYPKKPTPRLPVLEMPVRTVLAFPVPPARTFQSI